jgi:uncharacterized membrane protein YhiD involved in acid resistance
MNMGMALTLAIIVSYLYRFTHAGYSYSRSFNISLIGLALIVCMTMMVIADQLALSLGLVGAVSIIRFRTAVKDPRDLSYIFLVIAIGVACSTANYVIAAGGGLSICLVLLVLHFIHFGRATATDYTLSFCIRTPEAIHQFSAMSTDVFSRIVLRSTAQLDSETYEYVYTVYPKTAVPAELVGALTQRVPGISRISLIQPETFVDV